MRLTLQHKTARSKQMPHKKQFFTQLIALTAIIVAVCVGIEQMAWAQLHPYTWPILLYNVLLSTLSFLILTRGIGEGKDAWDFNNHFMGNTAFRLFITAILLFIYYYKVKVEAISFTITFFAFYFIYTIFEIKYLLSNLRQNSKSLGDTDGK